MSIDPTVRDCADILGERMVRTTEEVILGCCLCNAFAVRTLCSVRI